MLLSSSYDDSIKVWCEDEDDWHCSQTLTGHKSTVWNMAFIKDGLGMVSCSDDNTIILWQNINHNSLPIEGMAITITIPFPITIPTPITVSYRLTAKWIQVGQISGDQTRTIYSVAFSTTGVLASASADNSIAIYEEVSPSQLLSA